MFDYQGSTQEQMIEHIKEASSSSVTRMKKYYEKIGKKDVVRKIDIARERVKLEKVQQRMEELENDN